jgi:hypothetical protein
MLPPNQDRDRCAGIPESEGPIERQWSSPYKAMNVILQGELPAPAPREFGCALEKRLHKVEYHQLLQQLRHALAWFGSLLVLEGD